MLSMDGRIEKNRDDMFDASQKHPRQEKGKEIEINGIMSQIIECIPEAVLIMSSSGKIFQTNAEFERGTGWRRDEVIGRTPSEVGFLSKESLAILEKDVMPVLFKEGFFRNLKMEVIRRNGSRFPALVNWTLLKDKKGLPTKIVTTAVDISELNKLHDELIELEERYQSLIQLGEETGQAVVILQDIEQEEGIQTFVSRQWAKITGYSVEDLTGRPFFGLISEKDRSGFLNIYRRKTSKESFSAMYTMNIITKDGSETPVEVTCACTMYKGRESRVVYIRDISDRIRIQNRLENVQELLRLQIDRMPIGLIVLDKEFHVQSWNPAAEKIFGYSADEVVSKHIYSLIVPEKVRPLTDEIWSRLLNNDITANSINENLTRDGRIIVCKWTNTPLVDKDGTVLGVLSMVEDITREMETEKNLKDSEVNLKNLIDLLPIGIRIFDHKERNLYANRTLIEMFGCHSFDEFQQCNPEDFLTPESYAQYEKVREMHDRGEKIPENNFEITIKRKDNGELRYLIGQSGDIIWDRESQHMAIFQDVTEQRKMSQALSNSLDILKRTLQGVINVIAATVEMRDPYTSGHQKRVALLSREIAREMGLPEQREEQIYTTALIHDIGKIKVPAEILSKPGKLNDIEFSLIKMHSRAGYDLLNNVEFPFPLARWVLEHHERLNGSGYPSGLKGEEISLEARILAVADVVEAMCSHRPYRPALGVEAAMAEISRHRGELYDPEVVDVCLRLFKEKGFRFE